MAFATVAFERATMNDDVQSSSSSFHRVSSRLSPF